MNVLVTGAAGFIGSHLVERLLDDGHQVVALDNFDTFYDPAVKHRNLARARDFHRFTEVRGDIRDPATYARVPGGVDTVVHLAARAGVRPSIEDPHLYLDVNLRGTMVLLDFMRAREIDRLLFASSSSVYGDSTPVPFSQADTADRPISPYAATKRSGELHVHSHGHFWGLAAVDRNPRTFEIVNLGGAHTISLRRMIDEVAAAWHRTQHEPAIRVHGRRRTNGVAVASARPSSLRAQPSLEVGS